MSGFPYVAPPDGGLEQAFAEARQRRFRTAGLSTSSLAAVLTVAVAVLGGSGTQSLVQQPAPQQPAVSQVLPVDPEPGGGRANAVAVVERSSDRTTGGPDDTQGAAAQAGPTAPPLQTPRRPRSTAGARAGGGYSAPPLTREDNASGQIGNTYATNTPGCSLAGQYQGEPANDLCTDAWTVGGTNGTPFTLQTEVCSSRTQLTLLNYSGSNEVDLEILRAGQVVWRWSTWHPDQPDPHKLGLDAQSCIVWAVDWPGVDGQGRKLPAGDYELRATFAARELSTRVGTYGFTIR